MVAALVNENTGPSVKFEFQLNDKNYFQYKHVL